MALLGISLIFASVIYVIMRSPPWFSLWRGFGGGGGGGTITDGKGKDGARSPQQPGESRENSHTTTPIEDDAPRIRRGSGDSRGLTTTEAATAMLTTKTTKTTTPPPPPSIAVPEMHIDDTAAMPPPPLPPAIQPPPLPTVAEPEPDSPTTPKASATPSALPVPSFSLSDPSSSSSSAPTSMMPPPPRPNLAPSLGQTPSGRIPSLSQFPAPNSAQRARGPAPNRGLPPPSSSSSGLAPPPMHSAKPSKPSRQVLLTPGHSPLDWARISGPSADLRGLPPSTPYLRVTPSMLKAQTGRRGKDAWMALSGRVYNVTPYADFHPGGVPELMRGAGRDATKLFGEIHPWVNYETMLTACLVGLLVEEPEPGKEESEMDQMD